MYHCALILLVIPTLIPSHALILPASFHYDAVVGLCPELMQSRLFAPWVGLMAPATVLGVYSSVEITRYSEQWHLIGVTAEHIVIDDAGLLSARLLTHKAMARLGSYRVVMVCMPV